MAEMCGCWDIDEFAEQVSIRDVQGWAHYWTVQGGRVGSLTDPVAARTYLEGLVSGGK